MSAQPTERRASADDFEEAEAEAMYADFREWEAAVRRPMKRSGASCWANPSEDRMVTHSDN
ncbi:hypothetical protein [Actinomadura sp. 6N118]|uniref:hypothetical protein n=1 Tax=Actinomadura sp. 6N118 TaxID=3375151 RepID=UPI0037960DBC